MRLHHSQCFHCVKTDKVHKTRSSAFTSFLLKNACKRREMLVLALVSLVLHNLMRLHHSQCFHSVKTDNVHKTRLSASNVIFAEKRVQTQGNACFRVS